MKWLSLATEGTAFHVADSSEAVGTALEGLENQVFILIVAFMIVSFSLLHLLHI